MFLFINAIKISLLYLVTASLVLGLVYPAVITILGKTFFTSHANGSLIWKNNVIIGSQLLGQHFYHAHYFWGRHSATPDFPYNAFASQGSNISPMSDTFLNTLKSRIAFLQNVSASSSQAIPIELLTASGSGLDPHITLNAARYQIPRVANARHLDTQALESLIEKMKIPSILSEPYLNVLEINIALDELSQKNNHHAAI